MSNDLTMDEMLRQIFYKLHGRPAVKKVSPDTVVPSHSVDFKDAEEAARRGEVELVKTYLRLSSDNTNSFYAISFVYHDLRDQGVENPEQYLSALTVHTYISMWNDMMDMKADNPLVDSSGILRFTVLSGDEECLTIKRIVHERRPTTVKEVRALLTEVKSCASAVSSGVL